MPANADLLMLVEPSALSEKALFAVDQFLMRGGTVVVNTSPFAAALAQSSLNVAPRTSGLEDWLAHHGVSIGQQLVLDPQSTAFPIPVTRQVGGFSFQELVLIDYPYFVDVRGESGFADPSPITAELPQVSITWASPIDIDSERNAGRTVTTLLRSSEESWLSEDTNVLPRIDGEGRSTFTPGDDRGARALAVMLDGRFDSFFAGEPSPLLTDAPSTTGDGNTGDGAGNDGEALPEEPLAIESVLERSPESARLFVVASNDFLSDQITQDGGFR